jgi:hypothetical protein
LPRDRSAEGEGRAGGRGDPERTAPRPHVAGGRTKS